MPDSKTPVCIITEKPCNYIVEEFYDDEGNLDSWDEYCKNCGAWKDYTKSSGPRPDTHVVHR